LFTVINKKRKWKGWPPTQNTMAKRETFLKLGFQKLVQAFDDYESSRQSLEYRDLTPSAISKHFEEMKLDPEVANHNPIASLSSGQKVSYLAKD
jgi:elongation factor 3